MKCYICKQTDEKINMQKGKSIITLITMFDFMPMKYQYFHRQCLQSVICEPQDYSEEMVKCALECHDYIMEQKAQEHLVRVHVDREKRILKSRLDAAQDTLECFDEENSV